MDINPRWIIAFRAVAEAGSMSAGARALGLRQPTVTSHVTALEHALGFPLLVRHHSGVTLTEAGHAVLSHAQAISYHTEAIATEAQAARTLSGGVVWLAAFPAALGTFVPQAWALLRSRVGQGLGLHLIPANPAEALELLDAGTVDVAVVYQHLGDPGGVDLSGYSAVPIGDYEVCLVLPIRHRLANRPGLALADLADEDWIFGFTPCHDHLVRVCQHAGFEPRVIHESDDYTITQELVAQGLGVAALTRCCLELRKHPGIVARPIPELSTHHVVALCRAGERRLPSIRAVLNALHATRPRPSGPACVR